MGQHGPICVCMCGGGSLLVNRGVVFVGKGGGDSILTNTGYVKGLSYFSKMVPAFLVVCLLLVLHSLTKQGLVQLYTLGLPHFIVSFPILMIPS